MQALVLVSLCCVPFSVLLMYPDQMIDFGQNLIATRLFVANVHFLLSSGYFQTESELKPLLHIWSLAIEEQFYFIFPAVLLLANKLGRVSIVTLLWTVVIICFSLADYFSTRLPDIGYFLLPTRAWELAVGGLLAIHRQRVEILVQRWPKTCAWLAWLGLALILFSVALFSPETPFPGRFALLPVLGKALIIAFSCSTIGIGRLLSVRWIVGIGLVSYSAYLWHQPVFAFARLSIDTDPNPFLLLVLCLFPFVLAALSWHYVEQPFRNREKISFKHLVIVIFSGTVLAVCAGASIIKADGFVERYPHWQRDVVGISKEESIGYTASSNYASSQAISSLNGPSESVLIIGDSFSQDLFNIMQESRRFKTATLATLYVPARCGATLGSAKNEASVPTRYLSRCRDAWASLVSDPRVVEADIVLVSLFWRRTHLEEAEELVRFLQSKASGPVVIVGSKDFEYQRSELLQASLEEAIGLRVAARSGAKLVNQELAERFGMDMFVDPMSAICEKGLCPAFDRNGRILTYDGRHLTPAGARFFAERMFSSPLFLPTGVEVGP